MFNKTRKVKNKQITLEWILAHVGIMENEHADQLAQKGAAIKSKPTKQLELHKQINIIKHKIRTSTEAARGKSTIKQQLPKHQRTDLLVLLSNCANIE